MGHLNGDHRAAINLHATQLRGAEGGDWGCTGGEPDGIDLQAGTAKLRLDFPERVTGPGELRKMLVRLAGEARAAGHFPPPPEASGTLARRRFKLVGPQVGSGGVDQIPRQPGRCGGSQDVVAVDPLGTYQPGGRGGGDRRRGPEVLSSADREGGGSGSKSAKWPERKWALPGSGRWAGLAE